jgi:hypothetical protein
MRRPEDPSRGRRLGAIGFGIACVMLASATAWSGWYRRLAEAGRDGSGPARRWLDDLGYSWLVALVVAGIAAGLLSIAMGVFLHGKPRAIRADDLKKPEPRGPELR